MYRDIEGRPKGGPFLLSGPPPRKSLRKPRKSVIVFSILLRARGTSAGDLAELAFSMPA